MALFRYTPEHLTFLRENYPKLPLVDLTPAFNCHFTLDKTRIEIKNLLNRRKIKSGRTGQFPKGHVPWTAGTKGRVTPNKGQFKNGGRPAHSQPIGTEHINAHGYIEIKISENPSVWQHKSRLLWAAEHGSIAPGFKIRFKDGNRLNCAPNNLMLINGATNFHLNLLNYNQSPDEFKPSLMLISDIWAAKTKLKNKVKR